MAKITDNLSLNNSAFAAYAFYTAVLAVKVFLMALLTVIQRVRNKVYCRSLFSNKTILKLETLQAVASREDSPKGIVRFSEDVERQRRAHLNDLENIPIFLIIAFLYILTTPTTFIAVNLIRIFAAARIIHTLVYAIYPLQPARGISFGVGLLVTLFMALNVLIFFS